MMITKTWSGKPCSGRARWPSRSPRWVRYRPARASRWAPRSTPARCTWGCRPQSPFSCSGCAAHRSLLGAEKYGEILIKFEVSWAWTAKTKAVGILLFKRLIQKSLYQDEKIINKVLNNQNAKWSDKHMVACFSPLTFIFVDRAPHHLKLADLISSLTSRSAKLCYVINSCKSALYRDRLEAQYYCYRSSKLIAFLLMTFRHRYSARQK